MWFHQTHPSPCFSLSLPQAPRAQASDARSPQYADAPSWTPPPTRVKAAGRIVAIGDLHGAHPPPPLLTPALSLPPPPHNPTTSYPQPSSAFIRTNPAGDLAQSMRALQLAGVIGLDGNRAVWTGGNTTLVQMGDILDRGNEEIGAPPPPLFPQPSLHRLSSALRAPRHAPALTTQSTHPAPTDPSPHCPGILFLLQRLAEGAEAAGGAVYVLNGAKPDRKSVV